MSLLCAPKLCCLVKYHCVQLHTYFTISTSYKLALKLYIQQNLQKWNLKMLLETLIIQVANKSM